ncbi:HAD family hydrolase [Vibrio splendidus]
MKKIVIFDICDTLVPENTTVGFIKYAGFFSKFSWTLLFNKVSKLFNYLIWKLFDYDFIRSCLIYQLKGLTDKELSAISDNYVAILDVNTKIEFLFKKYTCQGFDTAVCSATINPVAESIKRKYLFDFAFSSSLFFERGVCRGKLLEDLYGKKLNIFKELRSKYDYIVFVTDNVTDAKCLQYCDEFIAVIPEGKAKNISVWSSLNVTEVIKL